jgi:hypothetical protein
VAELLSELFASPGRVEPPEPEERPLDARAVMFPRNLWGENRQRWLDAVRDDLLDVADPEDGFILCEWRREAYRDFRTTMTMELWQGPMRDDLEDADLETLIIGSPTEATLRAAGSPVDGPRFVRRVTVREMRAGPVSMLALTQLAQMRLGWDTAPSHPFRYIDPSGTTMARILRWRDGLPQTIGQNERTSEGQRIVLSRAGFAALDTRLGRPRRGLKAWRTIVEREESGAQATSSAMRMK